MKQLIKEIQQQPHGVKSQFAFIGASVCTGVIVLIWLTTLPARFSDIGKGAGTVQNSALTEHALSAYDLYKQAAEKAQQAAPTNTQTPSTISKSELEDKVSALIDSVRKNDLHTTAAVRAALPASAATSAPAVPKTVLIEVASSSSPAPQQDDSNIGKTVLIETR